MEGNTEAELYANRARISMMRERLRIPKKILDGTLRVILLDAYQSGADRDYKCTLCDDDGCEGEHE